MGLVEGGVGGESNNIIIKNNNDLSYKFIAFLQVTGESCFEQDRVHSELGIQ